MISSINKPKMRERRMNEFPQPYSRKSPASCLPMIFPTNALDCQKPMTKPLDDGPTHAPNPATTPGHPVELIQP